MGDTADREIVVSHVVDAPREIVFEAFTEHTTECRESLRELTEALNTAAEGLAATADSYEDFETAAAEAIDQFFEELR